MRQCDRNCSFERQASHSILGGLLEGFWLECLWFCEGLALDLPTISNHTKHPCHIEHLRSPSFPFLSKTLNNSQHLLPTLRGIHTLASHAHTNLLLRMRHQQLP